MVDYKKRFIEIVDIFIKRDGIDELMKFLEHSDFYIAPASTQFHESYEGGLVEHSVKVYERLMNEVLSESDLNYKEFPEFTMETIAIIGLFHDICKAGFYKKEMRNTKDESGKWVQVPFYKVDDKFPVGHSEKSVILLQQFIKLTPEEILAINAHMGGWDKRDYVISQTFDSEPLAVLLHIADIKATYLKVVD